MSALRTFLTTVVAATPAAAASSPKPDLTKRLNELTDKKLDEIIGDPTERLAEILKWKVPLYSKEYKDDTPEIQYLKDMESGAKKGNEYIKFINKQIAYMEEFSTLTGQEGIGKAAKGLKTITGKLAGGLGTAGKIITKVKQGVEWVHAFDKFADDTIAMKATDGNSVERWVGSMQRLWDATAPFAEWAQNKAAVAAIVEGSQVAAAFAATLAIVGAQVYVGIKVLEAGVKVVNAYYKRREQIFKEIERGETGASDPPPPAYPGDDWKSREDLAEQAVAFENRELRDKIHRAQADEREKSQEHFEKEVFPPIYLKHRDDIIRRIRAAMGEAEERPTPELTQGDFQEPEYKWWDCLKSSDSFGESDSTVAEARKTSDLSPEEAREEIEDFKRLSSSCPFFKSLYDAESKKFFGK